MPSSIYVHTQPQTSTVQIHKPRNLGNRDANENTCANCVEFISVILLQAIDTQEVH